MKLQQRKFSRILLLVIVFAALATHLKAQSEQKKVMVDSVNINELPDLKYIQVLGVMEKGKLMAEVDYGVKLPVTERRITDDTGKPQLFDSMVNVLNYLDKNDWEFLNAFEIKSPDGMVYHFLLRKKGTEELDLSKNK